MIPRKSSWLAAAVAAAFSCTAAAASAQDGGSVGSVRITDGKRQTAVQQASFGHHGYGYGGYGNCPTGDCYGNNCYGGNCYGNCYGGHCFGGCFQEHYCKNSPDHGYSPPAKYPLLRRGVQYNAYFPNQWYGTPGAVYASGFPMVYQPTDTAQLGFYYQQVPFWQPNPAMLPARPIPGNMHIVAPAVSGSNFQGGYYGGNPFDGYMMGGNCPVGQVDGTMAPQSQPAPKQVAPAVPSARYLRPVPSPVSQASGNQYSSNQRRPTGNARSVSQSDQSPPPSPVTDN